MDGERARHFRGRFAGMDRVAFEADVRARLAAGDREGAAEAIVRGYGPEILGWLHQVMRDAGAAEDVFGAFCEALWRALEGFRGDASLRTWAYALAHHCRARHARDPHRRRARPLLTGELAEAEARARTETRPW